MKGQRHRRLVGGRIDTFVEEESVARNMNDGHGCRAPGTTCIKADAGNDAADRNGPRRELEAVGAQFSVVEQRVNKRPDGRDGSGGGSHVLAKVHNDWPGERAAAMRQRVDEGQAAVAGRHGKLGGCACAGRSARTCSLPDSVLPAPRGHRGLVCSARLPEPVPHLRDGLEGVLNDVEGVAALVAKVAQHPFLGGHFSVQELLVAIRGKGRQLVRKAGHGRPHLDRASGHCSCRSQFGCHSHSHDPAEGLATAAPGLLSEESEVACQRDGQERAARAQDPKQGHQQRRSRPDRRDGNCSKHERCNEDRLAHKLRGSAATTEARPGSGREHRHSVAQGPCHLARAARRDSVRGAPASQAGQEQRGEPLLT